MSKHDSKYWQVVDALRTKIVSGEYPPGSKLPGQFTLAKEYGVSAITSNRALNELRELGLAERRERKGTFVAEHPQTLLEIVVVVEQSPYQLAHLDGYWNGISSRSRELNISCQLIHLKDPSLYEKVMTSEGGRGVIFILIDPHEAARRFRKANIPVVVTGREVQYSKHAVLENRRAATRDLCTAMINDGCRSLAFIGTMIYPNTRLALSGYFDGTLPLNIGSKYVIDTKLEQMDAAVNSLLARENAPDGVIMFGNHFILSSMLKVIQSEKKIKLGIMTEVSALLQLRDSAYIASFSQYEVGRGAVDLLSQIAQGQITRETVQYPPYEILVPKTGKI